MTTTTLPAGSSNTAKQCASDAADSLITGLPDGLTSSDAAKRIAQYGPNTVAEPHDSVLRKIIAHFWAPVPWMLEAAIILQILLGERVEAAMITALLVFNVAIGMIQEGRANAALALLKKRLSLKAQVRRDRQWIEIPSEDLVPGDLVRLSLGTIVPADVKVLDGNVLVDQSMLTGESVPVEVDFGQSSFASALIRRGEAIAIVTATGSSTYFGRTAELVSTAKVESSEVKAVLSLVRNLSLLNAVIVTGLVVYAHHIALPMPQILMLVLTAMLSAVPVALPATFTLASTLGARTLAKKGVLLTRLSALQEAATIDVLCADKTGTLTTNVLTVMGVQPLAAGFTSADVLTFAAVVSSSSGEDPIDTAVLRAASATKKDRSPTLVRFTPFDPTTKRAEAVALSEGAQIKIAKGAPGAIAGLAAMDSTGATALAAFDRVGYRTLSVAAGADGQMSVIGLIAFSDQPRPDSAELLVHLRSLGVETVMITGDAAPTAATVAHSIGLDGAVCPAGEIPDHVRPEEFAVYAGVFPEDKFRLVKAFQETGHSVGMCGDGANDAPALKQAQMGIAVASATDVAKAAAGVVLTEPGLSGIINTVEEGRAVFQRVLTYSLSIIVNKVVTLMILGVGLLLTGHAVLTPLLQALSMLTNDFVSMARTTDRTTPSLRPNSWRIQNLIRAGLPLACCKLAFCSAVLAIAHFRLHLTSSELQTLMFVTFVFAGQSLIYVLRERGHMWRSRPSGWMMLFSGLDLAFVSTLAIRGQFMQRLSWIVVITLLGVTALFALILDQVKIAAFRRWQVE